MGPINCEEGDIEQNPATREGVDKIDSVQGVHVHVDYYYYYYLKCLFRQKTFYIIGYGATLYTHY
jgi:hypothetical protein